MDEKLESIYLRFDTESPGHTDFLLDDDDIVYIRNLVMKTSRKIRTGNFFPKRINAVPNCQMNAIVPGHSFMQRHISINRDEFRSLLAQVRFANVPTQEAFRHDDELAARWYWNVFDFQFAHGELYQFFLVFVSALILYWRLMDIAYICFLGCIHSSQD